ncbi:MAG: hypothetical protein AABZ83_06595, partial [candidate division NC10 bacterium]
SMSPMPATKRRQTVEWKEKSLGLEVKEKTAEERQKAAKREYGTYLFLFLTLTNLRLRLS